LGKQQVKLLRFFWGERARNDADLIHNVFLQLKHPLACSEKISAGNVFLNVAQSGSEPNRRCQLSLMDARAYGGLSMMQRSQRSD
jgi:hypothetical protein